MLVEIWIPGAGTDTADALAPAPAPACDCECDDVGSGADHCKCKCMSTRLGPPRTRVPLLFSSLSGPSPGWCEEEIGNGRILYYQGASANRPLQAIPVEAKASDWVLQVKRDKMMSDWSRTSGIEAPSPPLITGAANRRTRFGGCDVPLEVDAKQSRGPHIPKGAADI